MAYKPNEHISVTQVAKFVFEDEPEGPQGVSPEFLADLHDLVLKFGGYAGIEKRILSELGPVEIHIMVNPDPSVSAIIVMGAGGQATEGLYGGSFVSDGIFFWDKRIKVEDIVSLIKRVDTAFVEDGWVDPQTEERIRKEDIQIPPSPRSVAQTFQVHDAVLPVASGVDPESVCSQFDHPEELAIIEGPLGTYCICLLKFRHMALAQIQRRRETLREMGVSDDDLETMTGEEALELLKLLAERETKH